MANPIKYSTGSETKALKKGNFFFGTGDVGKGPSDVTGYYQAVDVPQPGYVVYQYLESSASNLTYATLNSDDELINFTNGIAGESFTSVAQCLNYYATQNDKVCFNRDYEPIVTDGLVLNLDAGFDGSYTTSGNTWRDLSVSGNNGTLTNNPSFYDNGGGSIVFDGTNDYVNVGNIGDFRTASYTLESFVYPEFDSSQYGKSFLSKNTSCNSGEFSFEYGRQTNKFTFATRNDITLVSNSTYPKNNWYHAVLSRTNNGNGTYTNRLYINGVLDNTTTVSYSPADDTGILGIGVSINCTNVGYWPGKIAMSRIYNRALSDSEVLQNYNATKDRFAFIFTVDTTQAGTTSSTQFKLPLVSSGSVNFVVEWGDGTTDTITSYNQAETTHTYSSEGTYEIKIRGILRGWKFNNGGDKLKMGVIKNWGCLDISTDRGFYGCTNMTCVATDAPIITTTSLERFFQLCSNFNGPIGNWNVSSVTGSMNEMFAGANLFNQNIGNWDVSNVTTMINMFFPAASFNNGGSDSINNWEMSHRTNFTGIFRGATSFNQPLNLWDTSNATSMDRLFEGASSFNQNISSWDVSGVTNFLNMFYNATEFNNGESNDIDNWRFSTTSNISMFGMFAGDNSTVSCKFNRYIGSWNTERVTNMSQMFRWNRTFNQDIGNWNTSNVTLMNGMLQYVSSFNQNINTKIVNEGLPNEYIAWDVSKVTNMGGMLETTNIQYSLNNWDTSNVTNMSYMCAYGGFNADISSWNTSKVTNMSGMFDGCPNFNQNINTKIVNEGLPNEYIAWDVSKVTNMSAMFVKRTVDTAFNQDISDWVITGVTNFSSFMLNRPNGSYSSQFLTNIYNKWSLLSVKPNINISFGSIKYTASGLSGRNALTGSPNNWTISDGGQL